jgi:membrane-bound serine protease (ClpP class)
MKLRRLFWFLVAGFELCALKTGMAQSPVLYSARISGSINPAGAAYLERVIELASQDPEATAVLIELNTPGGLLASTRQMIQQISRSRVPVLLYVGPSGASATSAGAILLVASHAAGMSPGSNVGAAHPVGSQGEDIKGAMGEKSVNDTVALVRSLAEERGRPVLLSEEMVRKSRSLTAKEALENKLIDSVSDTPAEFLAAVDGKKVRLGSSGSDSVLRTRNAVLKPIDMTMGQSLLHFLADPNVATLLMSLGGLLIYVEVANPGITIAGILGGICMIAGFMSFQLLPIRTGGLILIVLAILMLVLEAVTASTGALAAGGILALVLGILWVMDPAGGSMSISPQLWIPVVLALSVSVVLMSWLLTRSRRLIDQALTRLRGAGKSGLQGYPGVVDWVDPDHPASGKIVIRGEGWNAVSVDGRLEMGEKVEVVGVEGFTVKVRRSFK